MSKRKPSLREMRLVSLFLLVLALISFTGCMSIQDAAREGNIEHIKTLLALGTDIDSRTFGGDGGSALHRASAAGQVETVKFLIEKGANVNIRNEASQTPIHYAAWNGHAEIVKILIENGAYVSGSETGHGDKVPLPAAARGGYIKVAEILLAHGADINAKGINEYTPLGTAVSSGQVEMVKYLLSKGADVNARAIYGCTPLYTAVSERKVELARLLSEHGANANLKCNGRTPLMASVSNDDVEMTEMLLSFGADVNVKDDYDNTALYISYTRNNVEIGRTLLEHGADPTVECGGRAISEEFLRSLQQPEPRDATESTKTLEQELYEIDKLRAGFDAPFDEVEKRCNELLKKYTEPEEQGKIYFELVQVEGQSGFQRPEKTLDYINKALERPQEPLKKVRLYIYWGDAIQTANRGVRGQQLLAPRRKAAMAYLNGLKETLQYDLPEVKPDIPIATIYTQLGREDTEEYQSIRRKHREQIEAQQKARFQQDMIQHRDVLTSQISSMYSRFPWASDEIRELAKQILEDETAVERLMSAVNAAVQQRMRELGWEPG